MLTVCVNHMTVQGNALEVTRFMNASTQGPAPYRHNKQKRIQIRRPDCFSLHSLVSIPESVQALGETTIPRHKTMKMGDVDLRKRISCAEDWCQLHWGCPSDVADQKISRKKMGVWYGQSNQASLDFSFETFSNPPLKWFEAVFAMFPTLTFQIHYELRGQFAHGYVLGMKGESWESGVLTEPADIFTCPDPPDNEENNPLPMSADSTLPF